MSVNGAIAANHGPSLACVRQDRNYKLAAMRLVLLAVGRRAPAGASASANPRSVELRKAGFVHAYNLDHDKAVAAFKAAVEADPSDSGAYRAMAAVAWLNLLYQRGSVSVDDYLGSMTQPNVKLRTPPPELAAQFHTNIDQALKLAEARLRARPDDPDAHFEVGAAVGQIAAYTATVDGKVFGGFTAARRAFDEHERVLALDPSRKDAGLIIGTYRYIVANLNMVMRWMAYAAGFGGGRDKAVGALEACGQYPGDGQTEAKLALVLIYNRERRYDDALRILGGLRDQYPLNRLLWLELGATQLRAGRAAEALSTLDAGVTMFENDPRPKAFGEGAMWHFKRGSARVAAGQTDPGPIGPGAGAGLRVPRLGQGAHAHRTGEAPRPCRQERRREVGLPEGREPVPSR